MQPHPVAMAATGITKVFPGTVALQQVAFHVHRAAVNVLMGENGAGPSTLMRILAGIDTPTAGQLLINGAAVTIDSPAAAARHGIAMVHQELSLMPNMPVAENIFAGREIRRGGLWVDRTEQDRQTRVLLESLSLNVSPSTPLDALSIGQQQLVEIARALGQRARVLILDEPTSALSHAEIEILFSVLRKLKSEGVAIIYVSHRLKELLEIGDHFTILRDGKLVANAERAQVSESWIVEQMTGRASHSHAPVARPAAETREVLRVDRLTLRQGAGSVLEGVSFCLGRGEIAGIYGLLGAGRTELMEVLVGLRAASAGRVALEGTDVSAMPTADRLRAGLRLVPEDRQKDGLIPQMSIRGNASLSSLHKICEAGLLSHKKECLEAGAVLKEMLLKAGDLADPVTTLSGGNQQKVLLARVLMTAPKAILLDEPTRGVDVGAKAEIYALIRKVAAQGTTILFSSSDAQEIRELAARVLVLCRGKLTADMDVAEADDEKLLLLADTKGRA